MKEHWYILSATHWIRCEIVSNTFGLAVVRLYNEQTTRTGRARKGMYGLLIEAK